MTGRRINWRLLIASGIFLIQTGVYLKLPRESEAWVSLAALWIMIGMIAIAVSIAYFDKLLPKEVS